MRENRGWWREFISRLLSTKLGWAIQRARCKWFGHTWYYNYLNDKYCPRCQHVVGGEHDKVRGKQKKGW